MNKLIRQLILQFLQKKIVVQSWGITNICVRDCNITFSVNGYFYSGTVDISLNGKSFNVNLPQNGMILKGICLEDVTATLDRLIESGQDY